MSKVSGLGDFLPKKESAEKFSKNILGEKTFTIGGKQLSILLANKGVEALKFHLSKDSDGLEFLVVKAVDIDGNETDYDELGKMPCPPGCGGGSSIS